MNVIAQSSPLPFGAKAAVYKWAAVLTINLHIFYKPVPPSLSRAPGVSNVCGDKICIIATFVSAHPVYSWTQRVRGLYLPLLVCRALMNSL